MEVSVLAKSKVITIVVLCISLALLVLGSVYLDTAKGDKSMNKTQSSVLPDVRIPPIDVAASTKMETATFALG